jgi:hypothetical protein
LSRSSTALGVQTATELGVSARAWRVEHQALQKAANESTGALDAFIQAQNSSNDACSSRLLESKRVLDGLLKDLKAIEEQVEAHEELLSTETENLNITHNAIDAAETIYENEVEECTKEKEAAEKDLAMYNAELEELKQIANPSVRYEHSVKVTLPEKPENFNAAENQTALLDQGVISLGNCQAFKAFSQHSKILQVERAKNLTCDEQRDQLQEVFTETYLAVVNLIKDAKARMEDTECFDAANAQRTSSLVPLTAQREQAAARIEYSEQALAALTPVLKLLQLRVDKLQKHIDETLTPECKEAAKVSETLQAIRELIISLEKCPGRNDFSLKIPVVEEDEDEASGHCSLRADTYNSQQLPVKCRLQDDVPMDASKEFSVGRKFCVDGKTYTVEKSWLSRCGSGVEGFSCATVNHEKDPGRGTIVKGTKITFGSCEKEGASALQKMAFTTVMGGKSALQKLGSNKTEVQKHSRTSQHTAEMKMVTNAQQMAAKPHQHHHHHDQEDDNGTE